LKDSPPPSRESFCYRLRENKMKKYVKSSVQAAENMLEYVHAAAKED
jgi:hypothetical protein